MGVNENKREKSSLERLLFSSILVVALHTFNINGHPFIYGVISRRSTYRAGTRLVRKPRVTIEDEFSFRLFIRGIDDEGRVANFVETEQILQLDDIACSYVQVKQKIK